VLEIDFQLQSHSDVFELYGMGRTDRQTDGRIAALPNVPSTSAYVGPGTYKAPAQLFKI